MAEEKASGHLPVTFHVFIPAVFSLILVFRIRAVFVFCPSLKFFFFFLMGIKVLFIWSKVMV